MTRSDEDNAILTELFAGLADKSPASPRHGCGDAPGMTRDLWQIVDRYLLWPVFLLLNDCMRHQIRALSWEWSRIDGQPESPAP